LDHALIEKFISPDQLSKSWAHSFYRGPFVLPPQPNIAINHTPGAGKSLGWQLRWFDPQPNIGGVGAISLVAHVFKISEDDAAWRLAQWLAAAGGYDLIWHLAKEPANG
jgi:hypothetical protein